MDGGGGRVQQRHQPAQDPGGEQGGPGGQEGGGVRDSGGVRESEQHCLHRDQCHRQIKY